MCIESSHVLAERQGGIAACFDAVVSVQKKAFIGNLTCMHFLAKQEIAHTTNFTPLALGQNQKYTSERFMQLSYGRSCV